MLRTIPFLYDPYENFLFTREEYDSAKDDDLLKLRCNACGKEFFRKKKVITSTMVNFNPNKIAISFCSPQCGDKPVEYECAYCGKHMVRPFKLLKKTKSNLYFCGPKCKAKYYEDHEIVREKFMVDINENPFGNFLFTQKEYEEAGKPKNVSKKLLDLKCLVCGNIFKKSFEFVNYVVSTKAETGKYCSYRCQCSQHMDEIMEKRKSTCIEKYGHEFVSQVKEIRQKTQETMVKKYGENPWKSPIILENRKRSHKESYWETFIEKLRKRRIEFLGTKENYLNDKIHQYKCMDCGNIWETQCERVKGIFCPKCYKEPYSKGEKEHEMVDNPQSNPQSLRSTKAQVAKIAGRRL